MTLDEKLNLFYKSAIDDATKQSVTMIEEYRKNLQQSFQAQEAEETACAQEKLRMEFEELRRERNKRVSTENLILKQTITQKTLAYETIIFKKAKQKLIKYMKTPDYLELLKKQILSAIDYAKGKDLVLYMNQSDQHRKQSLESLFRHEIILSPEDFIGGTRAVIPARNLLIDNSFSTRLAEEKDSFVFKMNS